jgi:hypothetical protein
MARKGDFTEEEWEVLRTTPYLTALAVAVAGGSGIFGSLKEAMAPAGAIIEAAQGDNGLLRDICNKEEMKASQESLKGFVKGEDIDALRRQVREAALEKVGSALGLLASKGAVDDTDAYRQFVTKIADRVAKAAKEGGFLGFGGERVSENERALLADLAGVVGTAGA